MELLKTGVAGTLESGDIYVEVEKCDGGVTIELDSTVLNLYGRQIREVITETVKKNGIDNVRITATDKGALDCTIRARVGAAAFRAAESTDFAWEVRK